MKECFEVVDATDDERYWPMGIWMTLSQAMSATSGETPDMVLSDYDDDSDCVIIEIRRREFGYSGAGRVVHRITFNRTFMDAVNGNINPSDGIWTRTDKPIEQ